MANLTFGELSKRSIAIRKKYHRLERKHHGSEWTIEEDALAFLTDAALVGRLTMANQKRWPAGGNEAEELEHKLGEAVWWLTTLADRMGIDIQEAVRHFLSKTEKRLE